CATRSTRASDRNQWNQRERVSALVSVLAGFAHCSRTKGGQNRTGASQLILAHRRSTKTRVLSRAAQTGPQFSLPLTVGYRAVIDEPHRERHTDVVLARGLSVRIESSRWSTKTEEVSFVEKSFFLFD